GTSRRTSSARSWCTRSSRTGSAERSVSRALDRRLLQRFELAPGIAGERRLRVLVDQLVERLLRVGALPRFQVGFPQLHQDAVHRQWTVLALRHLLEGVDGLIVLAGACLRFGEAETGHLAEEAVARPVDHLLKHPGRLHRVAERQRRRGFLVTR